MLTALLGAWKSQPCDGNAGCSDINKSNIVDISCLVFFFFLLMSFYCPGEGTVILHPMEGPPAARSQQDPTCPSATLFPQPPWPGGSMGAVLVQPMGCRQRGRQAGSSRLRWRCPLCPALIRFALCESRWRQPHLQFLCLPHVRSETARFNRVLK